MQLNRSFVKELKMTLEESSFSADDFSFSSEGQECLVAITFLHYEAFQVSVKEIEYEKELKVSKPIQSDPFTIAWRNPKGDETEYSTDKVKAFEIAMSPGKLKAKNIYETDDLSHLKYDLKDWCYHIEQELLVIYAEEPLCDAQLSEQIDEMFPEKMFGSDERFNESELSKLKESLSSLKERIRKMREECDISEDQIKELESALDKAEGNSHSFPKGAWLRFNKKKITNALKKIFSAPEVRKLGYEIIKKIVLKEI